MLAITEESKKYVLSQEYARLWLTPDGLEELVTNPRPSREFVEELLTNVSWALAGSPSPEKYTTDEVKVFWDSNLAEIKAVAVSVAWNIKAEMESLIEQFVAAGKAEVYPISTTVN